MTKIAVLLADGFEEIEAISVIDILRRAGIDTVTFGLHSRKVHGSHGIAFQSDDLLDNLKAEQFDMVFLPGGQPGSNHLKSDERVIKLLQSFSAKGKKIGAVCAAPTVLAAAGLLEGINATSYPGYENQMAGANYSNERVVIDGDIITSRGPGTAAYEAFKIVEIFQGKESADKLRSAMQYPAID